MTGAFEVKNERGEAEAMLLAGFVIPVRKKGVRADGIRRPTR
ncbi:hypothetical protein HX92_3025 [Mycobacterium tuberculosis]|nr:hypothetical protein CFBS_2061 [Mycobacterium tuberculosis CCDC5079]AHJ42708.1 hypothetical protein HKBS1_2062 [Mycobacterium tuberculosis HKBS1]AHJ46856.1 hypothetical protein HKBT2_2059 [Mycobacterium tuberculosis BT2]AHJ51004.1 hypothetical protein HKBT1_2058 [Mycobacterium tuberculosis BT1]AHJ55149.1 hypothetical protein CFBR_2064 [Mycobacterium tuberculosis CCDC5180]AHM07716.1 hypothetical protein BCGT_1796 [Mycobacterium tuberculosis variant bovis BCG str. ATCC 35743]AKR01725.1 hypot